MIRVTQTLKNAFVGEISLKGYVDVQIIGATLNLKTPITNVKTNTMGTVEVSGAYEVLQNRFKRSAAVFVPDTLDSFKPNA
jgi:hypothetical protein